MIYFISGTAVLYCSVVVYLIYKAKTTDYVKMTSLPVMLLLAWLMGYHYMDRLGAPIEGFPTDKFTYVHHQSTSKLTQLWVEIEGKGSRLYVFEYDQKNEEKLEDSKKKTEQGIKIEGEAKEDGDMGFVFDFQSPEGQAYEERFTKNGN